MHVLPDNVFVYVGTTLEEWIRDDTSSHLLTTNRIAKRQKTINYSTQHALHKYTLTLTFTNSSWDFKNILLAMVRDSAVEDAKVVSRLMRKGGSVCEHERD
jgi:hypothetical protein